MTDSVGSTDSGMKTGMYLHLKTISRLKIRTLSINICAMIFTNFYSQLYSFYGPSRTLQSQPKHRCLLAASQQHVSSKISAM